MPFLPAIVQSCRYPIHHDISRMQFFSHWIMPSHNHVIVQSWHTIVQEDVLLQQHVDLMGLMRFTGFIAGGLEKFKEPMSEWKIVWIFYLILPWILSYKPEKMWQKRIFERKILKGALNITVRVIFGLLYLGSLVEWWLTYWLNLQWWKLHDNFVLILWLFVHPVKLIFKINSTVWTDWRPNGNEVTALINWEYSDYEQCNVKSRLASDFVSVCSLQYLSSWFWIF